VDPHIFADPDPGSQNLADPTDPDPKHWTQNKHHKEKQDREKLPRSLYLLFVNRKSIFLICKNM